MGCGGDMLWTGMPPRTSPPVWVLSRSRTPSRRSLRVLAASSSSSKPTASWLGTGIMGYAMADRLMEAGYPLVVWNRTPDKAQPLVDKVERSEGLVFAMLSDPSAAQAVAAQAAPHTAGKGYIDISTVDAQTSQGVSEAVRSAGGRFLEAPVSGSKKPAQDGTLIFLCGGDESLYKEAKDALDVMGKAALFLGDVGAGARMKLVINLLMGSMTAALSEALTLSKGAGLREEDFLEVLKLGACAAPYLTLKGPLMARGEFATNFPLKHQAKDLRLALELGREAGTPLALGRETYGLYEAALALGLGDADACAVMAAQQRRVEEQGA